MRFDLKYMRIAIVAEPFVPVPPRQYGGTEQVIYYLIKGLKEAGHEPILLGTGDSTVDCELIPITDKAIYFPATYKDIAAHKRNVARIRQNTHRQLTRLLRRVDIVHSHSFDLKSYQHFPNLTTIHTKFELSELSYYMARRKLYYASISHNQQAAGPFLNYAGVVYNGEDPSDFPLVAEPQDYVCFLGRFDREKNPHLAIQLAINLGIKIKLAGKIDYLGEGYFEEEVAKYFDHPLVEYLGELNFEEKVELLSNARCNLHPTGFREPFGLTVLEAAYCGTPTLAIARGSMPELIEEAKTGMLVEDFVEGFYQIEECFKMDRNYISSRAREKFNYQQMTKDYIRSYRTVLQDFANKKQQKQALKGFGVRAKHQLRLV